MAMDMICNKQNILIKKKRGDHFKSDQKKNEGFADTWEIGEHWEQFSKILTGEQYFQKRSAFFKSPECLEFIFFAR